MFRNFSIQHTKTNTNFYVLYCDGPKYVSKLQGQDVCSNTATFSLLPYGFFFTKHKCIQSVKDYRYCKLLLLMAASLSGQERILSFEGGSSRSHYVEESFWRRLWTCRQTEYWMNEWIPIKSNIWGGKYRNNVLKRTAEKLYNIAARTDTGRALSTEWAPISCSLACQRLVWVIKGRTLLPLRVEDDLFPFAISVCSKYLW